LPGRSLYFNPGISASQEAGTTGMC
jgi:hypothetical protein